jgi:hypothetical protein
LRYDNLTSAVKKILRGYADCNRPFSVMFLILNPSFVDRRHLLLRRTWLYGNDFERRLIVSGLRQERKHGKDKQSGSNASFRFRFIR